MGEPEIIVYDTNSRKGNKMFKKLYIDSETWTNGLCHSDIGNDFFEVALEQADLVFISSIHTGSSNIRGFAFVNIFNYEDDPKRLNDTWYINLVCMADRYKGAVTRRGTLPGDDDLQPTGKALINEILYRAAINGKRVTLKAIDTVLGYYNSQFGFRLANPIDNSIISADKELKDLAKLQVNINKISHNYKEYISSRQTAENSKWVNVDYNDEYGVKEVSEVGEGSKYYKELQKYESDKNKVLRSAKFKSSVSNFFKNFDRYGQEAVEDYGRNDGYYMISPEIESEYIQRLIIDIRNHDQKRLKILEQQYISAEHEQNIEYNVWGDYNDIEPRGIKIRTKRRRRRLKSPKTIKRRKPKKIQKKTIKRRPKRKNRNNRKTRIY
jgi:hypothetical protein